MKTGMPTNGSMVKNHISLRTGFGLFATHRTSFLLWFQACQVRPLDLHHSSSSSSSPTVISPVPVSDSVGDRSGQPDGNPSQQNPQNK